MTEQVPDIESIHRDLTFANNYRMELVKHLMTIAGALLAFTVTFRPTLKPVVREWLVWPGWLGLGFSMIGGLFNMLGWEHFYKSYRDYDWKKDHAGEVVARKCVTRWRGVAMVTQFAGFIVGVLCIAVFAALNLKNVVKP